MAKNSGKKARKQMYQDVGYQTQSIQRVAAQKFPKLEPQSYRQEDYIEAINNKDIVSQFLPCPEPQFVLFPPSSKPFCTP